MISVIVPVYNVEDYLKIALDSLVMQTFYDFEVILINDGSTDMSGNICEEYARLHSNFHVYHKKNGGQSAARNFGIKKAKGEFFTFLDSDDYFESHALELFMQLQKKYNADIVSTKEKEVRNSELNIHDPNFQLFEDNVRIFEGKTFLEKAFYNDEITVSNGGKLFKKEVLNVCYPNGKIYEDLYVFSEIALNSKRVVHTNIQVYNYLIREGSTVHSSFKKNQYDFFEAIEHNKNVLREKVPNGYELEKALIAKKVIGSFILSNQAIKTSLEDVKEIKKRIKPDYFNIMFNHKISLSRKIQSTLFLLSPNFYYFIIKLYKNSKNS